MSKRHIFDFANKYYREYETLPSPSVFEVNDELYNNFITYLSGKDYEYETRN